MKRFTILMVLVGMLVLFTSLSTVAAQDDMDFSGVTLDVVTFTGPQIAEPLQRRGAEFSEMTGATVNVVTVPFSDLYQTVLTDQATGTNSYDAFIFAPQWLVDYAVPGYLADLTPF
ncbi:MAG: extracellular solute-binding protein, partial [Chloroflexota bacterium]